MASLRVCAILVLALAPSALAQRGCNEADVARHPVVILPGIMASQINASFSGLTAAPCVGRRSMHQVWPPNARNILPTGLSCWMYMVGLSYNMRTKKFSNNPGVKVEVETGGASGTEYGLWQSSYTNLTDYLSSELGYMLGEDMFGAPFDWRLHLSGMERAGQMRELAGRIEDVVDRNCGKKAVLIGHSMGGLVSLALLHRDPRWTSRHIAGFVAVSAPYGGTTDQAIAVRLGSVDFNINEWVKMPMARAAADVRAEVAANASAEQQVAVAVADMERDGAGAGAEVDAAPAPAPAPARAPPPGSGSRVSTAALFGGIDSIVSNYISSIFYRATMGLPGLSMLLPYASAYGANRRIVVTDRTTYTASMMQQLMGDIGDGVTAAAWRGVQELDGLLERGRVPGVPTYCLYAVGKDTTLTWNFPNINRNKPLLVSSPLVVTGGDGTVSMQSLKQCYRITDGSNITEVGDFGHLEVLKDRSTLAELGRMLAAINGQPAVPPTRQQRPGDPRRGWLLGSIFGPHGQEGPGVEEEPAAAGEPAGAPEPGAGAAAAPAGAGALSPAGAPQWADEAEAQGAAAAEPAAAEPAAAEPGAAEPAAAEPATAEPGAAEPAASGPLGELEPAGAPPTPSEQAESEAPPQGQQGQAGLQEALAGPGGQGSPGEPLSGAPATADAPGGGDDQAGIGWVWQAQEVYVAEGAEDDSPFEISLGNGLR